MMEMLLILLKPNKSFLFVEIRYLMSKLGIYIESKKHVAICHLPPATCHLPPATCHLPPATCHLPPATCHLPPATCRQQPAASSQQPAASAVLGIAHGDIIFRGSVPLFWEQRMLQGRHQVVLSRTTDASKTAFTNHINVLQNDYSKIHIVDLLDGRVRPSPPPPLPSPPLPSPPLLLPLPLPSLIV
jgi:hypothetical protein